MHFTDITQFSPANGGLDGLYAEGFGPIVRQQNPVRIREAARLLDNALKGRIDPFLWKQALHPTHDLYLNHLASQYPGIYGDQWKARGLRESMSITDYQALFVDVVDRQYYGYFRDFPLTLLPCVKQHTCMDFRLVSRYLNDGAVTPFTKVDPAAPAPLQNLTGPVPQGGSVLQTASTAPIQYQPSAYQSGTSVTWAAGVNDDMGIFRDLPNRLAMEANRGIAKFISSFFWDINGPSATLFTSGFANIINIANGASVNNPPLDAQGIQDGLTVLNNMLDSSGQPIMFDGVTVYLIYPRTMKVTVKNLMSTMTSNISVTGGTQAGNTGFPAYQLVIDNWMKADVVPVMDPYLNLIATNHPKSWALVADPGQVNRPAVEFGRLKGFETPQLFQRVPNIQRLGGGLEVTMGQFDTLTNDLKIIGVMGGAQIEGRGSVASNGSGA